MLNRIKLLCREKGVTLTQLATSIKINPSSIFRWSTSTPSADKLAKVADYFGVSVDYLLGRQEEKNIESCCEAVDETIHEMLLQQAKLIVDRSALNEASRLEIAELTKSLALVADLLL